MLARNYRFHGYGSLKRAYQHGQTIRGQLVSLRWSPRTDGRYRVAIVVSRKVHKSAVMRNRIRRRVYECVRLHEGELMPADYILTVFSDQVAGLEMIKLQATISGLLQKAAAAGEKTT